MRESALHYPELIRGASIGFADFLFLSKCVSKPVLNPPYYKCIIFVLYNIIVKTIKKRRFVIVRSVNVNNRHIYVVVLYVNCLQSSSYYISVCRQTYLRG